MAMIDLAYFNYEHGGRRRERLSARASDPIFDYDFSGLVRVMGDGGRWPDLFSLGEADYYEFFGGAGMWGAVEAMRAAGGPPYVPLLCSLPREWGPFAPMFFYNPVTMVVRRWYDHRAPDAAPHRNRNLLLIKPVEGEEVLHVVTTHGDLFSPAHRLADAEAFRFLNTEDAFSAILADWNEMLSGPKHEPSDLGDPKIYNQPAKFHHRLRHRPGRPSVPADPPEFDTAALDYLCGWWDYELGKRVGGIGFIDVAEHAGIYTPTNHPASNGRQCYQLDHILVNEKLAPRVVPGSVRIHEPADPERPDSDHKRVSVTVELH